MSETTRSAPGARAASLCPCKSLLNYGVCCRPYHAGKAKPRTAEQLMRSRYSAHFFRLVDYLVETTHPETRARSLRRELEATIRQANWGGLEIVGASKGGPGDKTGKVEFVARYFVDGEPRELRELARFKRYKGAWKYLDAAGGE